jgi:small subunit ribosomal protein S13
MVHIAGKKLPLQKNANRIFSPFYGIGLYKASYILRCLGLNKNKKGFIFTAKHFTQMAALIEKDFIIEGKLKRKEATNIQTLISISAYRGIRHVRRLPVRGQRTHTNAKTCRRRQSLGFVVASVKKSVAKTQVKKKKK